MIKIFERAGYKSYADEVKRIVLNQLSDNETGDSSSSEEEHPKLKQPEAYPIQTPQVLSQLPPGTATPKSTEVYRYVVTEEENLREGIN